MWLMSIPLMLQSLMKRSRIHMTSHSPTITNTLVNNRIVPRLRTASAHCRGAGHLRRKSMIKLKTMVGALVLGSGLLAASVIPHNALAQGKNKHVHKATQNVTVTVDETGYRPARLNVKAGQPVRMTFVSKGDSCANAVSIPALKKTFSLNPGQKKEITFTPKRGQTIAFTCSMKMFKGKAVAK
jgi:plastocyanin domain-containing protein